MDTWVKQVRRVEIKNWGGKLILRSTAKNQLLCSPVKGHQMTKPYWVSSALQVYVRNLFLGFPYNRSYTLSGQKCKLEGFIIRLSPRITTSVFFTLSSTNLSKHVVLKLIHHLWRGTTQRQAKTKMISDIIQRHCLRRQHGPRGGWIGICCPARVPKNSWEANLWCCSDVCAQQSCSCVALVGLSC